jgi:hypothetical protein
MNDESRDTNEVQPSDDGTNTLKLGKSIVGVLLGFAVGISIGVVVDNIGLGIVIGVPLSVGINLLLNRNKPSK